MDAREPRLLQDYFAADDERIVSFTLSASQLETGPVLGDGDLKYLVESVLQGRLFFVYCHRRSNENVFRVQRYGF